MGFKVCLCDSSVLHDCGYGCRDTTGFWADTRLTSECPWVRGGNDMKQRDILLASEGDAWFERNQAAVASADNVWHRAAGRTPFGRPPTNKPPARLLGVGCANGALLKTIQTDLKVACWGLAPSLAAVADAVARGLKIVRGTADRLEFPDASFDVVIYRFCLYLCDVEDYARIMVECERVLAANGFVIILDFFADMPHSTQYHHYASVKSHKVGWAALFQKHSHYVRLHHTIAHQRGGHFTLAREEWVGLSLLAKM